MTVLAALVIEGFVLAGTVHAQGSSTALRIHCNALAVDQQAAFEARARAELMAASSPRGDLAVACEKGSARLAWAPEGEPPREREVSYANGADGPALVDALLDALHALLSERPAFVDRPAPAFVGAISTPAADSSITARKRRWSLVAGVAAELWPAPIEAVAGMQLGTRLSAAAFWSAALVGGFQWGLGSGLGVRPWVPSGQLRIEYAPIRLLRVGMGPEVRAVILDASALDHENVFVQQGTQRLVVTGGLTASARCPLSLGSVEISAGPSVEWLVAPVVVRVGSAEAFRMPSLVASFSVDTAVGVGD